MEDSSGRRLWLVAKQEEVLAIASCIQEGTCLTPGSQPTPLSRRIVSGGLGKLRDWSAGGQRFNRGTAESHPLDRQGGILSFV
jgi:hypothetical protein